MDVMNSLTRQVTNGFRKLKRNVEKDLARFASIDLCCHPRGDKGDEERLLRWTGNDKIDSNLCRVQDGDGIWDWLQPDVTWKWVWLKWDDQMQTDINELQVEDHMAATVKKQMDKFQETTKAVFCCRPHQYNKLGKVWPVKKCDKGVRYAMATQEWKEHAVKKQKDLVDAESYKVYKGNQIELEKKVIDLLLGSVQQKLKKALTGGEVLDSDAQEWVDKVLKAKLLKGKEPKESWAQELKGKVEDLGSDLGLS